MGWRILTLAFLFCLFGLDCVCLSYVDARTNRRSTRNGLTMKPSRYYKGFIFPFRFSWRCWFGWHTKGKWCNRCGQINNEIDNHVPEYGC